MARGSIGLDALNDYIVGAHPAEHPVLKRLRVGTAELPMARCRSRRNRATSSPSSSG